MLKKVVCVLLVLAAFADPARAGLLTNIAVNGSFDSGDTSGWTYFPSASSTFGVISSDFDTAPFSSILVNSAFASAAVIKQANLGVGLVNPGDTVEISFAAKGFSGPGGVAFAELFSEISGGGVSQSQILGGGPLPLTSDWVQFNFTTTLGPDVSGGVTLQFAAVTGAVPGSVSVLLLDSVRFSVVPEPSSLAFLGLAATGLVARRRRCL